MTYLVKQKFSFVLAAAALLSSIAVGMLFLRDVDYTSPIRALDTFVVRGEYAKFNGGNFLSGVFAAFGRLRTQAEAGETGESVPVLLYHGIVSNPDRFNISSDAFKEQMYALKQAGYQTVSLEDFYAFQRGDKKLPKRSFLLTFDDGRRDSFEGADPVLEALDFSAVMFMPASETVPDPKWLSSYYLSLNDVKNMLKSGRWQIGSHAVQKNGGFVPISETEKGNFLSNKSWLSDRQRLELDEEYRARITYELADARMGLESEFDAKIEAFAYPFGDYGQQTINHPPAVATIASVVGDTYRAAFRQVWQHDGDFILNYPHDNRLRMKRVETPTDWSGARLVAYLEDGSDKAFPFTDEFADDAGWRSTWGEASLADGQMDLKAVGTTGASVFLDGTRLWEDYAYRATFDWINGTNVTLLARYKDGKNYLSCTFGGGYVSITNTVDGTTYDILRTKNIAPVAPGGETTLGMNVRGGTATCLNGETAVAMASVPLADGGIGIKTWNEQRDVAAIRLKRVHVEKL